MEQAGFGQNPGLLGECDGVHSEPALGGANQYVAGVELTLRTESGEGHDRSHDAAAEEGIAADNHDRARASLLGALNRVEAGVVNLATLQWSPSTRFSQVSRSEVSKSRMIRALQPGSRDRRP